MHEEKSAERMRKFWLADELGKFVKIVWVVTFCVEMMSASSKD